MVMIEIILHLFVLLQFPPDIAFPHFYHIALMFQVLDLFYGRTIKFLHGFMIVHVDGIADVTFRATVPETALDFVRGMGFFVITVEEIIADAFLPAVACVLYMDFALLGRVRQPFVHKQGLFLLGGISHGRDDTDRIFGKVVGTVHEMAGRGDGERRERIDIGDVVKQFAKRQTTTAQNINVRTTVRDDFFMEIEHVVAFSFRGVPYHKRFFIFWIHAVGIVVGRWWNGPHVILVIFVKKMRKVTFGKFFNPKRFREIGEFHREKIERIDEADVKHLHH